MKRRTATMIAAMLAAALAGCMSAQTPGGSGAPAGTVELRRDKADADEAYETASPERLFTISTSCGEIQGIRQDGYVEYRGVRYAEAERWEQAEPVTGWDGVYDASAWGDRCAQYLGFYGTEMSPVQQFYANEAIFTWPAEYSEDCLNLNIWAPDNAADCPVLVYIHGGAFLNGSNTDTSTDGAVYAKNGIVMVAINYRLGPFAAAYDGENHFGNLALTDQIAALHWVRDNIADYGGDPGRIVIMGESAGAVSVQALLMSPLVEEGLVSGAIMMSGGGYLANNPTTAAAAKQIWKIFLDDMGAEDTDELKALPGKEVYSGWLKAAGSYAGASNLVVNGISLTENVLGALRGNTVRNVPCIFGILSNDCYPHTLYTGAVTYAKKRAEQGGEPVYLYYFDRVQPGSNAFGAFHAADLYYAFGTLYRNVRPFDDVDYRISEDMIAYFCNFVKSGDPNGEGLAVWEPGTPEKQEFLHFGDEEPAMVRPDEELLRRNEANGPAFPYAQAVESGGSGGQAADGQTAVAPEELLGCWKITGWDIPANGGRKDLDEEAFFEFDETDRRYYVNGELVNVRPYVWRDEYTIVITIDDTEYACGICRGENGGLRLEDPRYGIVYTCHMAAAAPE